MALSSHLTNDRMATAVDTYQPKRPLRKHQQEIFDRSKDMPLFALQMEQQTGKSKVVIDTVARLYLRKQIDALLVVAMPAGVERNWLEEHIPNDLPDNIPRYCVQWRAAKAKQKGFQRKLEELLEFKGLAVVAINGEGVITAEFRKWCAKFLARRKVFVCADETTLIMKTPGKKRTRVMHNIGKLVKWKRILDGTMHGEDPMDYWAQYAFLSTSIIGFTNFYTYRARYAVLKDGFNGHTGTEYKEITGYQNLEELRTKLAPCTARVLRSECSDSPPKVYMPKVYFQLTDAQRDVYDRLQTEYEAELHTGERVTAQMVLVRYLRLQQVASNWWPPRKAWAYCNACEGAGCEVCDNLGAVVKEEPGVVIDQSRNPRLEALARVARTNTGPTLVWSRFTSDVDLVLQLGRDLGRKVCRYDGKCSDDEKLRSRRGFQAGDYDWLVGNPKAGGRGVTLNMAENNIFYANDYSLLTRLQTEDRAEAPREEKKRGTGIFDLLAEDTIDDEIVSAHRAKLELANVVLATKGYK